MRLLCNTATGAFHVPPMFGNGHNRPFPPADWEISGLQVFRFSRRETKWTFPRNGTEWNRMEQNGIERNGERGPSLSFRGRCILPPSGYCGGRIARRSPLSLKGEGQGVRVNQARGTERTPSVIACAVTLTLTLSLKGEGMCRASRERPIRIVKPSYAIAPPCHSGNREAIIRNPVLSESRRSVLPLFPGRRSGMDSGFAALPPEEPFPLRPS